MELTELAVHRRAVGWPGSFFWFFFLAHLPFGIYSCPSLWLVGLCVKWKSNTEVAVGKLLPTGCTNSMHTLSAVFLSVL